MIFTIVTIGLILYFPISQAFFFPRYKKQLEENPELKQKFYTETIFALWVTATIVAAPLIYFQIPLTDLGIIFNADWRFYLAAGLLAVTTWILFSSTTIDEESYEKVAASYKEHRYMMPANKTEMIWMNIVSISAGITEEFIFRAYMFWYFNQYSHWMLSVILLNIAFSLSHVWSGKKNMFNAFLLGLFFSAVYIGSGSLLLVMVLHAIVDIYSGRIGLLLSNYEIRNASNSEPATQS